MRSKFDIEEQSKPAKDCICGRRLPFEVQERRNVLRPIVRLAANHRNYRGKVTLWYDKMILDNREYGVNNLSQLPSGISPMLACQTSNATIVGFFGEHSPFSNFHHSAFIQDEIKYATSEHWIQAYKARMFDDMHSVKRILKTQTPREVKKIGP